MGHQFGGFSAGIGNQAGGAVDDPVLALFAPTRLGLFAGLQQEVLDLGHGVHGVDERHTPELRELQARDPGHPIVRMDDVVAAVWLALADLLDLGHHAVQQPRQFFLGDLPWRPCQDVVDAHAGVRMFDGGLRG